MADRKPGIRATDNEALATQLWGDDKHWDEDRQQYVPGAPEDVEPEAEPVDEKPADNYDEVSADALRDELGRRGLSKSGTKPELVARLRENDARA